MIDNTIIKKEEKYPLEIIDLPSQGYFYDEDNPLSSGKLSLRTPTGKHEDILTSRNLITKGIVIDEFLKSLIADPINYEDILLGDKNGIIIAARILLYGPQYVTQVKCPNCSALNTKTYNIADIETKEIDLEGLTRGVNEFSFTLPHSKTKIKYKFLTQKDEQEIQFHLKKVKKHLSSVDPEITTRLSYVIIDINGITDRAKIAKFISEDMPSRDTLAFREHLVNVTPGVESDVEFICDECGHDNPIGLPMDFNFFWPSGRLQK